MKHGYDPKRLPRDLALFIGFFAVVAVLGALQCGLNAQAGALLQSGIPLDVFSSLKDAPVAVNNPAADEMCARFKKAWHQIERKPFGQHSNGIAAPGNTSSAINGASASPALPAFCYSRQKINGVMVHVIACDPRRRECKVSVYCARGLPNTAESFGAMVRTSEPRVAVAGTYFSKTTLSPVGDIVVDGKLVHFGGFGTAMTVTADGNVDFRRVPWGRHVDWDGCSTVLAAGPTLLSDGAVVADPVGEGFRDPRVLGSAPRCAVGVRRDGYLIVACVPSSVGLEHLAKIMLNLECRDAMTLDGGGSLSLFVEGQYVIRPSRKLTNILTIGKQ